MFLNVSMSNDGWTLDDESSEKKTDSIEVGPSQGASQALQSEGASEIAPEAIETDEPMYRKKSVRIAAGALVALLGIASFLFLSEGTETFPALQAGAYAGYLSGVPGQRDTTLLYVERDESRDTLFFALLSPEWQAQVVTPVREKSSDGYLPITLAGPETRIKLIGRKMESGGFQGDVINEKSGRAGSWQLTPLAINTLDKTTPEYAETRLWVLLKAELAGTERRLVQTKEHAAAQQEELNDLRGLTTDQGGLKQRAERKFGDVQTELGKAREQLKLKRNEALALQQQFELSQKVAGMGKLVALSRESLEREGRWVESMMKTSRGGDDTTSLDRARIVLDLRRQIDQELDAIDSLEGAYADGDEDVLYPDRGEQTTKVKIR